MTNLVQPSMVDKEDWADLLSNDKKKTIHLLSIFIPPVLFFLLMSISLFSSSSLPPDYLLRVLGVSFGLALYTTFLYYIAGGFDWKNKKLQVIRIILFWVLGDFLISLIIYLVWYFIRLILAKVYQVPMQVMVGRLLATRQKTMNPAPSKGNFKRFIPTIAGIITLFVVGAIGIMLTPAGAYSTDPNASPGRTVGFFALVASVAVFLMVKKMVGEK